MLLPMEHDSDQQEGRQHGPKEYARWRRNLQQRAEDNRRQRALEHRLHRHPATPGSRVVRTPQPQ